MFSFPQDLPTKQILGLIILSRTNNLFCIAFYWLPYLLFVSLSLTIPQQFPVHRPHKAHCIHLQPHEQIAVHFNHKACFRYFVSLLTSSEPTDKFKWITYSIVLIYVCMFSDNMNLSLKHTTRTVQFSALKTFR